VIRIENEEQGRALADKLRQLTGAELAAEVMELIEDNRDRWTQGSWRMDFNGLETAVEEFVDNPLDPACTTAFCFAGWVAAVHRVKWAADGSGVSTDMIGDPAACYCQGRYCTVPNHRIYVQTYAARVLGLSGWEAEELFRGDNTLELLRIGVEALQQGVSVSSAIDQAREGDDESVYG
jgi:hypothetical protein